MSGLAVFALEQRDTLDHQLVGRGLGARLFYDVACIYGQSVTGRRRSGQLFAVFAGVYGLWPMPGRLGLACQISLLHGPCLHQRAAGGSSVQRPGRLTMAQQVQLFCLFLLGVSLRNRFRL